MRGWIALGLAGLILAPAAARGQARPAGDDAHDLRIAADGNELVVRRRAPVASASLERFVVEVERPLPARASALRLIRSAPPEIVEYVLCVTSEGVLVVGRQVLGFDFATQRYVFSRGEIERSYPPLEQAGPWTWLLAIPVSRERTVVLEVRSDGPRSPVESVTIRRLP